MSLPANVNMDSAAPARRTFGPLSSGGSHKPLQGFNVSVSKDRCDHLAFFCVRPLDADIPLELPFPSLCVPCRPGLNIRSVQRCIHIFLFQRIQPLSLPPFPLVMLFISISTPIVWFSLPQSVPSSFRSCPLSPLLKPPACGVFCSFVVSIYHSER